MNFYYLFCACFLASSAAYIFLTPQDLASKILVALLLLFTSGALQPSAVTIFQSPFDPSIRIYRNRVYSYICLLAILLLLVADMTAKITMFYLGYNFPCIDLTSLHNILSGNFGKVQGAWAVTIIALVLTVYSIRKYNPIRKIGDEQFRMSVLVESSRYFLIMLFYGIAYIEADNMQKLWISITVVYTVFGDGSRLWVDRLLALVLVASTLLNYLALDHSLKQSMIIRYLYSDKNYDIWFNYAPQAVGVAKLVSLFMLGRQIQWQATKSMVSNTETTTNRVSRVSTLKRKKTILIEHSLIKLILVHCFTLFVLLTTTTIGSIVLAFCLFYNIPQTRSSFSNLLLLGGSLSLLHTANNPTLLAYLIFIKLIRAQGTIPSLPLQSFAQVLRVVILVNHVSVINFITGLFPHPYVIITIILSRILSRLFGYTNEVIGFGYDYGIRLPWVHNGALGDLWFWGVLITDRLNTTVSSNQKVFTIESLVGQSKILWCLRYWQWLAYLSTSFVVLSSEQSLFKLLQFSLLLIIICCEILMHSRDKQVRLRIMWTIYLYWLMTSVGLKYFYLFSKYDISWPLFTQLKPYQKIIGLASPNSDVQISFLSDFILMVITLIQLLVINIKLEYEPDESTVRQQSVALLSAEPRQEPASQDSSRSEVEQWRKRVYELYLKKGATKKFSSLTLSLIHCAAYCSSDSCIALVAGFYIFWEFKKPEYLVYLAVYASYFINMHLSSQNFHDQFKETIQACSAEGRYVQRINACRTWVRTFSKVMHSESQSVVRKNIFISAILILYNYLYILWNAFYHHQFKSGYRFIEIFPQFCILSVSILANRLHLTSRSLQQIDMMEVDPSNTTISYRIAQAIVVLSEKIYILYFLSLILCKDMASFWIILSYLLFNFIPINRKYLWTVASLLSFFGIYIGNYAHIVTLLLARFMQLCEYKASEFMCQNQYRPDLQPSYYYPYIVSCWMIPSALRLLLMPLFLYSLNIFNLPVVIILISSISTREIYNGRIKWLYYCFEIIQYYTLILSIPKLFLGQQFWLSRISIFCSFVLTSSGMTLLKSPHFEETLQKAQVFVEQRGSLLSRLISYINNDCKISALKAYHEQKEHLQHKINTIKGRIEENRSQQSLVAFRKSSSDYGDLEQQQQNYVDTDAKAQVISNLYFLDTSTLLSILITYFHTFAPNISPEQAPVLYRGITDNYDGMLNSTLQAQIEKLKRIQQPPPPIHNTKDLKDYVDQLSDQTGRLSKLLSGFFKHIDSIGFLFIIGWNFYGGTYTLICNIVIFAWAMPLSGLTPSSVWRFCFYYISFIMVVKFMLPYIPNAAILDFIFSTAKTRCVYEYILLLIMVCALLRLRFVGVDSKNKNLKQTFMETVFRTRLSSENIDIHTISLDPVFIENYSKLPTKPQRGYSRFAWQLFSKLNFKPGKDFYPIICTVQVLIFLYMFFFYDMIEFEARKNHASLSQVLTHNQFSKHMVIALFVQMVVMIVDRGITTYNYYDPAENWLLNFLLTYLFDDSRKASFKTTKSLKEQPQFKSYYDLPLIIKYVTHVIVLVGVNLLVFWYIPFNGRLKLSHSCAQYNQCQDSNFFYLGGFFALYQAYFFLSSLQIRHGFTRLKGKHVLRTKFHFVYMYIYKTFIAIPFLSEFKKLCDWTLTSTGLPLFHYLKFDDIHSRFYISKCEAEMLKRKPFGKPTWWIKYLIAPSGLLAILLIVFGPILMYSTANPFAVLDQVIGAEISLSIRINKSVEYQMFQNSHVSRIIKVENQKDTFQYNSKYKSLYYIELNKYPDRNSLLTEPVINNIVYKIESVLNRTRNTTIELVLKVDIIQKEGGKSVHEWSSKTLQAQDLLKLHDLLIAKKEHILISNFFSPFPNQPRQESLNIVSKLSNWEVYVKDDNTGLYYVTSSKFQIKFSVVSFYLTYVLLISRLMKIYLVATVENVVFEGSEVETVLYLCSAVISARRLENFVEEEYFYFELVDLIRQPEKIRRLTGSYLQFRRKY